MIKALYLRQDRTRQGKQKMTDLDERYFKTAEENLYSELALSLKYPGKRWRIILKSRVSDGEQA